MGNKVEKSKETDFGFLNTFWWSMWWQSPAAALHNRHTSFLKFNVYSNTAHVLHILDASGYIACTRPSR